MLCSNRFDGVVSMYATVLQRLPIYITSHANQLAPSGPQPKRFLANRVNTSITQ